MKIRAPIMKLDMEAMKARLSMLGIKVDTEGNVDPASVGHLRAGKLKGQEALASVLDNGQLTYEATEKLSRSGFLGFATAPVGKKETNALKSVVLNVQGINETLEQSLAHGLFRVAGNEVSFDGGTLTSLRKRIQATHENWDKAFDKDGLGKVSPAALTELREAFMDTVVLMSQLGTNLSAARSTMINAHSQAQGIMKVLARPLLASVLDTVEALHRLNEFATVSVLRAPPMEATASSNAVAAKSDGPQKLANETSAREGIGKLNELIRTLDAKRGA